VTGLPQLIGKRQDARAMGEGNGAGEALSEQRTVSSSHQRNDFLTQRSVIVIPPRRGPGSVANYRP
jgi:hypothetical protein